MTQEEALLSVIGLLHDSIEERKQQMGRILEIVAQSEKRIDRINEMVLNLTGVMKEMTGTYTEHIKNISSSRDELIHQNSRFIEVLENVRNESAAEHDRYDSLLDKYTTLAEKKSTHNNIQVR